MRKVVIPVALLVAAGAAVLVLRSPAPGPSPAPAPPPSGAAEPGAPEREVARQKLQLVEQQMKQALDKAPRVRKAVISGTERRPGEPEVFYEERKRAVTEFNHFTRDANLTPDQAQAVAGIIADAQDTWRNGLAAAHRSQPEAPGSEMADPVLSQLILSINDDVLRSAREVVPPASAAILQSYFPSMLPFVRTQAVETQK
jgi:hypothetical protein